MNIYPRNLFPVQLKLPVLISTKHCFYMGFMPSGIYPHMYYQRNYSLQLKTKPKMSLNV